SREVPLEFIEESPRKKEFRIHLLEGVHLHNQELDLLRNRINEELSNALVGLQNKNKIRGLCFQLHYFYGMSVKEIANGVRISEGTVKSHLYLARKYLEEKHPILSDLYFELQVRLGRA